MAEELVEDPELEEGSEDPADASEEPEFKAPHLERFGNPYTLGIYVLLLFLIIGGPILVALTILFADSIFWGVLCGSAMLLLGIILWVAGETDHSGANPREAGVLMLGEVPLLDEFGNPIVVGGKVFLANYAPFYLTTVKVNMDNSEKEFQLKLTTSDGTPLNVKVSVIARPNIEDILDFIQAGADMEDIWKQMDSIVFKETQAYVRRYTGDDIQKIPEKISGPLGKRINSIFASKSLGVKVVNVKVEAHLPEPLQEEVNNIKKEEYQRKAELKDYETMRIAARKLQIEMARDFEDMPPVEELEHKEEAIRLRAFRSADPIVRRLVREEKILDLDKCIERITGLRQVKEGNMKTFRIEGAPNLTVLGAPGFFESPQGKGGKKNKGKNKNRDKDDDENEEG
jgi:hypothetical protein